MAVIKQLRGLHVTIACQKEYADVDEEQAKGTVTKYIEAVSGKSFKINWRFESNFQYKEYDITSWIYLDGKKVDGLFIDSERLGPSGYVTSLGAARSKRDGKWIQQSFSFAALNVDEDNRDIHKKGLAESVQSLGEISVRLWRVRKTAGVNGSNEELSFHALGSVPEKALKGRGVSHQATLGTAQAIEPLSSVGTTYIDSRKEPFAVFNFRYRSRAALQALNMIPRSPEPVPLEDRPIDSLNQEEMRELLRRQREQLAAAGAVKKEGKVKRERPSNDDGDLEGGRKRQRSAALLPVEILDLTSDD
ncbi:hypothetical protein SLS56_008129 [Neofusicoccum ribis]|uniref:DUF7918 domain-containing protein n=1 Tax=Neofusicoccum ribis TaxID=45134 RepID=A0ABR3SL10_9PEZI